MAMGGGGGRDKLQSDINVTPLVDVCLVLLIIFMVVTPMLQKGVSVQIPQADNPDKKPESSKQKLISVSYTEPSGLLPGRPQADLEGGVPERPRRALPAQPVGRARHQGRPAPEVRRRQGSHQDDQGRRLPGRRSDRREEAEGRRRLGRPLEGEHPHGHGSRRRRRIQERHQHHAARRRGAGAADHLHGHHAAAPDGLRREGPAQGQPAPGLAPSGGPDHRVADARRTRSTSTRTRSTRRPSRSA